MISTGYSPQNESTDLKKKDIRSLVKSMKPGQIITILGGIKNWNYRYIKLDDYVSLKIVI